MYIQICVTFHYVLTSSVSHPSCLAEVIEHSSVQIDKGHKEGVGFVDVKALYVRGAGKHGGENGTACIIYSPTECKAKSSGFLYELASPNGRKLLVELLMFNISFFSVTKPVKLIEFCLK